MKEPAMKCPKLSGRLLNATLHPQPLLPVNLSLGAFCLPKQLSLSLCFSWVESIS